MFFTHASPGARAGFPRPHPLTDVILDISATERYRIRRAYKAMRRGGMSQYHARGFLWDLAHSSVHHGRTADHDVWRDAPIGCAS